MMLQLPLKRVLQIIQQQARRTRCFADHGSDGPTWKLQILLVDFLPGLLLLAGQIKFCVALQLLNQLLHQDAVDVSG